MNVLVLFSHPDPDSLNGAFLNQTIKGLKANPLVENIEVMDLYKQNFDPILRFGGDIKRSELYKLPSLENHRRQIVKADLLVLIYPIWWGRPPAMLLGYIDRLFVSDFAFKKVPGKIMPEGLLKGKAAVCISTMQGPTGYPALFLNNAHKALMRKGLFNFVGIRKVKFFELGSMEKKDGSQKSCLVKIEKYMMTVKNP